MVKWEIVPSKTALIVVDMNNNFLQKGSVLEIPLGRKAIPPLKNLIKVCRNLKIPVVYVTECFKRDGSDVGLVRFLFDADYPPKGDVERDGTRGVEIYGEIKPKKNDALIKKNRWSAFHKTNLEPILRKMEVDTLIIAGLVTDCCVLATAFDAFQRDFKAVVLSDCTAARNEKTQKMILKTISRVIGEVTPSPDVIERLQKSRYLT